MGSCFSCAIQTKALEPADFTLLTWNIAGLHPLSAERAEVIAGKINDLSPDVVILNEVLNSTLELLKKHCGVSYHFTTSRLVNYFNCILVRKERCKLVGKESMTKFENSIMGRYLLMQKLKIAGFPLVILASHLESLETCSAERKNQLIHTFNEMCKYSSSCNVIFAGDTNLRQSEVDDGGGSIPEGIIDTWIACGAEENCKCTKVLTEETGNVVKRYDRVYYTSLQSQPLHCNTFQLIGTEVIEKYNVHPSDHLGVLVSFNTEEKV